MPGVATIAQEQIIVGIDIGTTKVCTLIADVTDDVPRVLGVGISPSQGMRRGVIVDVQAAVDAIDASLRRAEQQSRFKALSAFIGVAGASTVSSASRAFVPIRHAGNVITADDVANVLNEAGSVEVPNDQRLLHVFPHHFIVDGVEGIRNPVGMVGRRLEVAANIVTGSTIAVNNLLRCMDAINISPDELVPEPLAVGRAVLTEEEGEFGALVIDLGGSTSDASIFHGGNLIYNCSLPVGGGQISNDLAFGLRSGFAAAEELKVRYGSTISRAREPGEIVSVSAGSPAEVVRVEQRVAAEIIDARLAETFELVQEQILRSGYADCYPGGVVLTGGTSQIRGSAELAREVLGVPSRVGAGLRLQGLAEAVQGPSYATSVGLVAWGREQMAAAPAQGDSGLDRWLSAIKAWFRNFA